MAWFRWDLVGKVSGVLSRPACSTAEIRRKVDMANWLDKARGKGASVRKDQPYSLQCECGSQMSGIRQERATRVICADCGEVHFVLILIGPGCCNQLMKGGVNYNSALAQGICHWEDQGDAHQ